MRKCLVLMPFAREFDEIYDLIFRPACLSQDVESWRVDERTTPGSITSDIVHGILDADLIIADLTGQNPNVFYELGIAHAFNKHVITVCQNAEDVPFDIRSYRVLPYSRTIAGAASLRSELEKVIAALFETERPPSNPVQDAMQLLGKRHGGIFEPNRGLASNSVSRFESRIQEVLLEKTISRIAESLRRITSGSSRYESVVISAPKRKNIYVQFAADKKGKAIYGEAVGNAYLKKSERLSSRQMQQLEDLGWTPPSDDDDDALNFSCGWSVQDEHDLKLVALEAARVLSDVYEIGELDAVEIELI